MSSPVNPILVVKNNLKEYAQELHDERIKYSQRLAEIDEQMITMGKLAEVVGVEIGTTVQRAAELGVEYQALGL